MCLVFFRSVREIFLGVEVFALGIVLGRRSSAARAAHREHSLAPTFVSGQSFLWDLRADALVPASILRRTKKAVARGFH